MAAALGAGTFCPSITLGELANGFYGTADHDLAEFFDSLSRSVPADRALDEASVEAILRLVPEYPATGYEETFASVQAAAIDAIICAAMNFTLVGLLRSDLWRFDSMGFVSGAETYVFDHVAEPSHAEAIYGRRIAALRSGLTARSFWLLRERVFPNLLFGLDVKVQVEKFNTTLMPLMFKRLAELDSRAKTWSISPTDQFPDGPTEIKPGNTENHETVWQRSQFSRARWRGEDIQSRFAGFNRSHRIHIFRRVSEKSVER